MGSSPLPNPGTPVFVQYTITASPVQLSAIAGGLLNQRTPPSAITVKNASGAANNCYLGPSTVANTPTNAGIELAAGQSYTFVGQELIAIYIVGTVNAVNIAFICAEY